MHLEGQKCRGVVARLRQDWKRQAGNLHAEAKKLEIGQ